MKVSSGQRGTESATGSRSRLSTLRSDFVAGLINAVVSVPDGLASAALAGVNPVYGLYTSMTAAITGSAVVSTQLMQVATTSASALAAGQAIESYPADQRDTALFTLAVLTGIFLAVFGLLKLGRLVRFVSHAVMTGFLIGVAVVLILDQFAPLVGYSPEGANEITQFVDIFLHVDQWDVRTVIAGVLALAVMVGLSRTKLSSISSLIALVAPALIVFVLGWGGVELVSDVSMIPRGFPAFTPPDLTLVTPGLMLAAFSLAVVIAVQGAGVSQSYENPDGSPVSASRDMLAQGAANVAAGLFSGIPAGGSVGQTALNVSVGARSRWGGIFGGLWMLAIVLLFPGLVGEVPMAVLAALMIVAGFGAIDFREASSIWQTGSVPCWSIVITFLATLVLSVPMAVATGVVFTIILFLASSASDVTIRAMEMWEGHHIAEVDPPRTLASDAVTVLNVYGSLFFAGARTLGEALPDPDDATHPVVVLRMRGRTQVGATLIDVLDEYADELANRGGRLYLAGVDADVASVLKHAHKLEIGEDVQIFPEGEIVAGSGAMLATWIGGLTLIALHWGLATLSYHVSWFGPLVKGHSVQLVDDGEMLRSGMRETGTTSKDLERAMRSNGNAPELSDILEAYLERDGSISVIPKTSEPRVIEVSVRDGVQTVRIALE